MRRRTFWKVYAGFIAACVAALAVGCGTLVWQSNNSTPPDYVKTDKCPTEDSCKWVPVSAWHWDWVPDVP